MGFVLHGGVKAGVDEQVAGGRVPKASDSEVSVIGVLALMKCSATS